MFMDEKAVLLRYQLSPNSSTDSADQFGDNFLSKSEQVIFF